jgi:hypothetical protein
MNISGIKPYAFYYNMPYLYLITVASIHLIFFQIKIFIEMLPF